MTGTSVVEWICRRCPWQRQSGSSDTRTPSMTRSAGFVANHSARTPGCNAFAIPAELGASLASVDAVRRSHSQATSVMASDGFAVTSLMVTTNSVKETVDGMKAGVGRVARAGWTMNASEFSATRGRIVADTFTNTDSSLKECSVDLSHRTRSCITSMATRKTTARRIYRYSPTASTRSWNLQSGCASQRNAALRLSVRTRAQFGDMREGALCPVA
jgi:hypothetical protein